MCEGACRNPPCRRPSTAPPLPRAIGVRSYLSYISLWHPIHIASGFGESAALPDCGLTPEALIGELGIAQTRNKTRTTIKKVGAARSLYRTNLRWPVRVPNDSASRVRDNPSSCDAPPIGVIRDKIVPLSLVEHFKLGRPRSWSASLGA